MEGIFPLGFSNTLLLLLSSSQAKDVIKKTERRAPALEDQNIEEFKNAVEHYVKSFEIAQKELHNPFDAKKKEIFAKEISFVNDKLTFLQSLSDNSGTHEEIYELQNDFFVNCRDLTYDDRINMLAVKNTDIEREKFFTDKTTIFYNQHQKIIFIVIGSEGEIEKYAIAAANHRKLPLFFNYMQTTSKHPSRFDLYMFEQVLPEILSKLNDVETMIIFFALQCAFDVEINQYLEMAHEDDSFAHEIQELIKLFKGVEAEENYLHYINNIQTPDLTAKSFHVLVERLGYYDIVKREPQGNSLDAGGTSRTSGIEMIEIVLPILS